MSAQHRIGRATVLQRELELMLGLLPFPRGEEDRTVVGTTGRVEVGGTEASMKVIGGSDPLDRSLDVSGPAARGDGATAHEHDGVEVTALARQGPGHCLVDQRRALVDIAPRQERGTELTGRAEEKVGILHASEQVSVLRVVWAPGMRFRPHNHLMWAAIGLYGGQEDNTFYRRGGESLVESGGRELRTGDVALLGDDTIHAVANPHQAFTGAIYVYGGNITARPGRSEWDEDSGQEVDYDFERTRNYFASFETSTTS